MYRVSIAIHLALLHNCRLRLLAESKGYRLDDTGLFPATHGSDGKQVIIWVFRIFPLLELPFVDYSSSAMLILLQGVKGSVSLKFDTEKEVFDFLGFPWLEPHERNL